MYKHKQTFTEIICVQNSYSVFTLVPVQLLVSNYMYKLGCMVMSVGQNGNIDSYQYTCRSPYPCNSRGSILCAPTVDGDSTRLDQMSQTLVIALQQ